jgi:hypothetical protein
MESKKKIYIQKKSGDGFFQARFSTGGSKELKKSYDTVPLKMLLAFIAIFS